MSVLLQDVLIPARRFEVEVVLGPHDGLSILEQHVLRAVGMGSPTVEAVAALLAIPARMSLDAAVDLLARGLIDVEVNGKLRLPEVVSRAMGDPTHPESGWFLGFQSAHLPETQSVSLVQDLVAGEVFSPPRGTPFGRDRLPTMPESTQIPAVDEIPLATLLPAVNQAMLAARGDSAQVSSDLDATPLPRDARVLDVRVRRGTLSSGGSGGPVAVRGIRVMAQVRVTERGADEPPRVSIVEPARIPMHVRRSIASALDGLWARGFGRGAGQFFERLRTPVGDGSADEVTTEVSPGPALARIGALLADDVRPVVELHSEITAVEDGARAAAEHLAAHAANANLLVGNAGTFVDLATAALSTATHQVLLACPWVGQLRRSEKMRAAVRKAVGKGVNVVIVWGISDARASQDDDGPRAVEGIRDEDALGALVLADRAASSHAKAIVCDADWMVVSSCNFLNAPPDRPTREVGLRVQLNEDGSVPLALQATLSWARRLIPDHRIQDRCLDDPVFFGRRGARPLLTLTAEAVLPPNLAFGDAGVSVWRAAWLRRFNGLRDAVARAESAVVPVKDAEHRDLLVRAIANASNRLLIESHRVTAHGLSEFVCASLVGAAQRKVEVRLRYGTGTDIDPTTHQRLADLRDAGISIAASDTHAKVLVCDEWAVVSSHNFLSVDPSARSAHELGLRVHAPALVDEVWAGSSHLP
jgi:hypothetical protein